MKGKFQGIEDIEVGILVEEDIDDIVEMLQDPKVYEYLYFAPGPDEIYRGYFEPIAKEIKEKKESGIVPENMVYILRDKNTKEFIGQSGVMTVPMIEGVYEIGYQLKQKYWRKGVATFACKLGLDYIFNELKGHRAEANCYMSNTGSKKVLEKCGFTYEGEFRGYYRVEDRFEGRANFGLLKKEYESLREEK